MSNQQFVRKKNTTKKKWKNKALTRNQRKEVLQLIEEQPEKKYYDETFDAFNASSTPQFWNITQMSQGSLTNERIGSTVRLLSVQYNLHIQYASADSTNTIRVLLFQWKPDNQQDLPAWDQIFQYHTLGAPSKLYELMSPYTLGEGGSGVFNMLYDTLFYLDSDNPIQILKGYINKKFLKNITFGDGSLTGQNHLYLCVVSDSSVVGHPVYSGGTRIRFTDS